MIYYILYLSAAAGFMDEAELEKILLVSRGNNRLDHITGVLLYGNNNFIQLLEGEKEKVMATFGRIGADKRHLDVTVISSGSLKERCFPDWAMGFKAVRAKNKPGVEDFIDRAKTSFANNNCELPVKLLQSFLRKARMNDN